MLHKSPANLRTTVCLSMIVISGCSTIARVNPFKENELEIEALQPMNAQMVDQQATALDIGSKLTITSPTEFSAPGFYSISIVPVEGGRNFLKVKLAKLPPSDSGDPQENANQLLTDVLAVQKQVAQGRAKDALRGIEDLQKTWPNVTMLQHLKASALVVARDYNAALAVIGAALAKNPNSVELKELQATVLRLKQP